jgi:copper transport protein
VSRPPLALLLLIALVAPLALVGPRPKAASAHAVLVRSLPEGQTELRDAPPAIDLWFSEPLEPNFSRFELYRSDGAQAELVAMRVDPADPQHLSALTRGLGPDIYTVVYRTLSTRDGHEWSGLLTFTVLNPDGSVPVGGAFAPDLGSGSSMPEVTGRWFVFVAIAVWLGGALLVVLSSWRACPELAPLGERLRRLNLRLGIAVLPLALGGSVIQLLARQEALGGSIVDLLEQTRLGTFLVWRSVAILVVATALTLALRAERRGHREQARIAAALAAGAATAVLVTVSLLSHAAAAPGSTWAVLSDIVHLVVASSWVGGLVLLATLLALLRRERPALQTGELIARFSLFATAGLGVLAATGLVRTGGELPSAGNFVDTAYGGWLVAKLALLLLPLAVALGSRAALQAWRRGHVDGRALQRRFRVLISIEATLALAVLAVVAVLGQLPTPRGDAPSAETAVVPTDVNLIEQVDDLTVHLQVSPAVSGPNELRVHLYHSDASDIGDVQLVQFTLGLAGGGGDALTAEPQGDEVYTLTAAVSPLATSQTVAVEVRRAALDDARISFQVPIQSASVGAADGGGSLGSPAPQLSNNFLGVLLLLPLGVSALVLSLETEPVREQPSPRRGARRAAATPGRAWRSARARTDRLRFAGTALVFAAIVLVISGSPHSHGGQLLTNPSSDDPASIVRGSELYRTNCVSCHGVDGRGDGPLALTLSPPPADLAQHIPLHPEGDTFIFIARGFPNTAMPAWSDSLTDEEIWDVVNYLRNAFAEE